MTEATAITIIGSLIAFLQAAIFFILRGLDAAIKKLDDKITLHHENFDIHCSAEMKKRCLAVK